MQNDEKARRSGQGSVSGRGAPSVRAMRPFRFVATVDAMRTVTSRARRQTTSGGHGSELPDEPDFHLQLVPKPRLYRLLRVRDHRPHIRRGGVSQVDENVGVNVRNLCIANAKALEAALIDQSTGTHTLDLLENRSRARMHSEPRMPRATPRQVLLQNAM